MMCFSLFSHHLIEGEVEKDGKKSVWIARKDRRILVYSHSLDRLRKHKMKHMIEENKIYFLLTL